MILNTDMAMIRERVSLLPREERVVVYLYFWEQETLESIKQQLGLDKGTVTKLLFRALNRLKPDLQSFIQNKKESK